MSQSGACKNRSIARLPLHIFTNLSLDQENENTDLNEFRKTIITKLQLHSIEDIGSLFKVTLPHLVRILNPILTYG